MSRLFVFVGSLIVLALFAALIGPYFIDWTSYRSDFEKQASRILGQQVKVTGSASARLLPFPSVTFQDVQVGADDTGQPLLTIDAFSMDTELAPYLKGELRIVDMRLSNPKLKLVIEKDGFLNWSKREQIERPFNLDVDDVILENVTVEGGEISLSDEESGRAINANGLNLSLSAKSLAGPWRGEGTGIFDKTSSDFKFSTGRMQDEGQIRTRLNLAPKDVPYKIETDGQLALSGEVISDRGQHYEGKFNLSAVDGETAAAMELEPGLPLVVSGSFDASMQSISSPDLRFEVGAQADPYVLLGDGKFEFSENPQFALKVEGQQIDLARFKPIVVEDAENSSTEAKEDQLPGNGLAFSLVMKQLQSVFDQLPLPDAKGLLDIRLPAIVSNESTIRDLVLKLRPSVQSENSGWEVADFSAELPGRTLLEAKGFLKTQDDFRFNGKLLVASRQPTGLANWLSGAADPAIRRLGKAGLAAETELAPDTVRLEQMELALGDVTLNGSFERTVLAGQRPSMMVNLNGKTVDLDVLRAFSILFGGLEQAMLDQSDTDVSISAEQLAVAGLSLNGVDTVFSYSGGNLEIDQFNVKNLAGAQIIANGGIRSVLTQPDGKVELTVEAKDARGILKLVRDHFGNNPILSNLIANGDLTSDLSADIEIKATEIEQGSDISLYVGGELAGTRISSNSNFIGSLETLQKARVFVATKFVQSDPQVLFRQFGIPVFPVRTVDKDAPDSEVVATLNGTPEKGLELTFTAKMPGTTLGGTGKISPRSIGGYSSDLALTFASDDTGPLAALAGYGVGGVTLPAFLPKTGTLFSKLKSEGNVYTFNDLDFTHTGNRTIGTFSIDLSEPLRKRFGGKLKTDVLSLTTIASTVFGDAVESDGNDGPWSKVKFGNAPLTGFDGQVELHASKVTLGENVPPGVNFTGKILLRDGLVAAREGKMDWLGGKATGGVELRNSNASGLARIQLSLKDANLAALSPIGSDKAVLEGRVSFDGTVEGGGSSVAEIVGGLSGGSTIKISDGKINNIDPTMLSDLKAVVDTQGFELSDDRVASLAEGMLFERPFVFGKAETSASVAGGSVRMSSVSLSSQQKGAAISVDGRFDIGNITVEGESRVAFDPGEDAFVGGSPAVRLSFSGPLSSPVFSVEAQGLSNYLTLRAFDREQKRVESLQADILEKRRLRGLVDLYLAKVRAAEDAAKQKRDALEIQPEQNDDFDRDALQRNLDLERKRRASQQQGSSDVQGRSLQQQLDRIQQGG